MAKQGIFRDVDPYLYNLDIIKNSAWWEEKDIRAEYVRLAKVANKRISRIKSSQDYGQSAKVSGMNLFPSIKTATNRETAAGMLANVALFLQKPESSLSGLRSAASKQMKTMREHGYDWINKGNIHEFRRFWKEVKKHEGYKEYGSDRIANLFKEAKRKRIDTKTLAADFKFWLDNEQALDTMKRSNETISSTQARERIRAKK